MPRRSDIRLFIFIFTFFFLSLPRAQADIKATAVTSATSWEEEDGTGNSAVSQYLDLRSSGRLGGFRLELEGYGRVTAVEEETEAGDGDPDRLYTLTLTLSDEDRDRSLTIGRQFVAALVGPEMLDGLVLRTAAGALNINARWGLRSDTENLTDGEESILGLGLDYRIREGMFLSLDYGRTYDEGSILSELIATEWVYSWHRFTRAYVNFNWDLMSRTLHESLVGTRLFFSDQFSAVFELSQNVQVFDSDSIYSVFAVDAAHTRSFSLLFTPNVNTRYVWDYAVESYQGDGGGRRYGVSGQWTPGRSTIKAGLTQHRGYGGDLTEVTASVSTRLLDRLTLGVGGDVSRTENPGEESVSSGLLYAGARWDIGSGTALDMRVQQMEDDLNPTTWSGRMALKLEF